MQSIDAVPVPDGVILSSVRQVRVAWQADRSKRYLDEAHRRWDAVATVLGRG